MVRDFGFRFSGSSFRVSGSRFRVSVGGLGVLRGTPPVSVLRHAQLEHLRRYRCHLKPFEGGR